MESHNSPNTAFPLRRTHLIKSHLQSHALPIVLPFNRLGSKNRSIHVNSIIVIFYSSLIASHAIFTDGDFNTLRSETFA